MPLCLFTSDLHGYTGRYRRLFDAVRGRTPAALFLGGDLLPALRGHCGDDAEDEDFWSAFLAPELVRLRDELGSRYPRLFVIPGNDDPAVSVEDFKKFEDAGFWTYLHNRQEALDRFTVFGYANVPPTPFLLKDWERYDVSRFVDVGAISPEEGWRTVPVPVAEIRHGTIAQDLSALTGEQDLSAAIMLFHSPPHKTGLDRAALDGVSIDHVPVDPHVGSIAIREFITARQPLITLHGHIHESSRLTGVWQEVLGRSVMITGAIEPPALALVWFDPENPSGAVRELC